MAETVVGFIVGAGIGFILGYIVAIIRETKEEVDEVLNIERSRDESGLLQNKVAFNITFAVLMLFVFYAAYSSFQNGRDLKENQKEDFIRVCQAGQDSRDVDRSTVDAIATLAISLTIRDEKSPPRTPEEQAALERFIDRTREFRELSYNQIKPSEPCLPFVTDDDVEPRPLTIFN